MSEQIDVLRQLCELHRDLDQYCREAPNYYWALRWVAAADRVEALIKQVGKGKAGPR